MDDQPTAPADADPVEYASSPERSPDPDDRPSGRTSSLMRWLIWLVVSAAFALFIAVGKVHTYLGVKVKPTFVSIGGFETQKLDMNGHEQVWRVWWRARHEMLSLGPSWGFIALLTVLGLLFFGLCVLAIWVALVPNETSVSNRVTAEPDVTPSP